jgi:lipopolysaccharide/colanic/teichoic acid biosynthesis glycosyltransferase
MSRWLEVVLSAILLLLITPILLIVAVIVAVSDGFPILYGQARVGKNFRPIKVWKFRTMRAGASERTITVAGDPRITAVGRFLRASKLDELPQLWNVFRGDMSFVGPRPEIPEYVEMFRSRFERLLTVRPGITDTASIAFMDEEQMLGRSADPVGEYREKVLPRKLSLAEEYIGKRSTWEDLKILFATMAAMLRKRRERL